MKVEETEAPIAVVYKSARVKEEEKDFQGNWSCSTSLAAATIATTETPINIASTEGSTASTIVPAANVSTIDSTTTTTSPTTPIANVSRLSKNGDINSAAVIVLPSSSSTIRQSSSVHSRASTSTGLTMVNTSSESFSMDLDLKTKVPQVLPNGPSPSNEKTSEEQREKREKNSERGSSRDNGVCSPGSIGKPKVPRVNGSTGKADYARTGGTQYALSSGTESPLSSNPIKPENEDSSSCRERQESSKINRETDSNETSDGPTSGGGCRISRIFASHGKLKRLLGTLIQFATNISQDTGDTVRTLVLGLLSGAMTAEEFHSSLQEATNVPLRGFVLPYLRHTLPSLRRDLNSAARSNNQTCGRYLQLNESAVLETVNVAPSSETKDLFGDHGNGICTTNLSYPSSTNYGIVRSPSGPGTIQHTNSNSTLHHHFSTIPTNLATKRRASDTSLYENGSLLDESPTYGKRSSNPWLHPPQQQQQQQQQASEAYSWYPLHSSGSMQSHSQNHAPSPVPPGLVQVNQLTSFGAPQVSHQPQHQQHHQQHQQNQQNLGYGAATMQNSSSLDDEWKNIHVMLNCILGMVEKTKRALAILQRRGSPSPATNVPPLTPGSVVAPHNGNSNGNSSCSNGSHGESSPGGDRDGGNFKRISGEFVAQTIRATEDKVAEVKRRAEEAVQEVKRAAVVEVQRAVAVALAESRANERLRVHRLLELPLPHKNHARQSSFVRLGSQINPTNLEASSRTPGGAPLATTQPSLAPPTNTDEKDVLHVIGSGCWNCGRTALETCGGCGVARYCGYFCQHRDWEAGGHHATCNSRSSRDSPLRSASRSPPRSTHLLVNSNDNDGNGSSPVTTAK